MKGFLACLTFLVTVFLIGFYIGRTKSIDSGNPRTAKIYLALYGKWKRIDATHGELSLRAGDTYYSYSTGDSSVSEQLVSPLDLANTPAPHVDFNHDAEKLLKLSVVAPSGIAAIAINPGTLRSLKALEKGDVALLALLTAGVGWLGYHVGHKPDIDLDNETFHTTLKDLALWKSIENEWRRAYRQYVDRSKSEVLRLPQQYADDASDMSQSDKYLCQLDLVHPEVRSQALDYWEVEHAPSEPNISPSLPDYSSLLPTPKSNTAVAVEHSQPQAPIGTFGLPGAGGFPSAGQSPGGGAEHPEATIREVWTDHNQIQWARSGMLINADIDVANLEGQELQVIAYVYWSDTGQKVINPGAACHGDDGQLCAVFNFAPIDSPDRRTVRMFLPYDEIPDPGAYETHLKYHVLVRKTEYSGELAASNWVGFMFRR